VSDPLSVLSYALAGTLVLLLLLVGLRWWRRERPDAAELERRRRLQVNRIGRIADGHIVDLQNEREGGAGAGLLLFYKYKVRGVEYQTAQDVGSLRARLDLQRLAAGLPAQVKFDPKNPTNSIVLCEEWSGI
jgi:hypothetical protein